MKTIYYYGIDNNKSGMENYAFNLIKNITTLTNNFHFHIITEYEDFAYKDELVNKYNCGFTVVSNKRKHPLKYKKQILKILKKASKTDLLQLNVMSYRNFLLFSAAKKSNVKTIIVGHSTNVTNKINFLFHKIMRFRFRNFGWKVANNKMVIDYLYGKKCKNVQFIELGINTTPFLFNLKIRNEIREKYNLNNKFVIGQVGRISKQKNQIFSCKIMKKLGQDYDLYLFGKEQNSRVRKYIKKNNLINVHICNEAQNINELYNSFDLFIFPSIFESAGFAFYEALTNGCNCLISDKIPLENIKSSKTTVLKLKEEQWVNFIKGFKQNYNFNEKERLNESCIPSLEQQVCKYLKLYEDLTK